jgi:P4 family phage/plasmid primase-like protien
MPEPSAEHPPDKRSGPEGNGTAPDDQVEDDQDHPTLSLEPSPTPYADGLPEYLPNDWAGVIPLKKGKKLPDAVGVTGYHSKAGNPSHWPTPEEYEHWATVKASCNLGLRLPEEIIGLDVDDYTGKVGGATLAKLEAKYGPMPPAWRSGSRRDGSRSGIYLYRVPVGLKWPPVVEIDGLGDIETIRTGHRTVAAWPSIHKSGQVYGWWDPSGELSATVPPADPAQHPELPAELVEYLTAGQMRDDTAPAVVDLGEAASWLTDGEPCQAVAKILTEYTGSSRHDTAGRLQVKILRHGEQGHQGGLAAWDTLHSLFITDVTTDGSRTLAEAEKEWAALAEGAPGEIKNRTPDDRKRCCARPVKNLGQILAERGKAMPEPAEETTEEPPKVEGVPDGLVPHPWKEGVYTSAERAEALRKEGKTKGKRSPWFSENGALLARTVAKDLCEAYPLRLAPGDRVAVYRKGVYRPDEPLLMGVLVEMLGDDYRSNYFTTINQVLKGVLAMAGAYLKERLDQPMVNVRNGWVDLRTGELLDHTPKLETSVQLPITYDPDAVCPTFDAWLEQVAGDQAQALLEISSEMLDMSRTPHKALLVYGPSRSGKSTYLRQLEAVAGKENRSAVTLHQLSDNRFAAAGVYGKILNIAADLSARHIEDLNVFKALTGEDPIDADPKYGRKFTFTNIALFAFSANEIPSVGESSRAYSERMSVFKFDRSFAGKENHQIELDMLKELPGIFNRLVQAWQARQARGRDLDQDPAVRQEFEQASDRVTQWVAEEMIVLHEYDGRRLSEGQQLPAEAFDETMDAKSLRILFDSWAAANGSRGMGRNMLISRLTSKNGVLRVRIGPTRKERFAIRKRREDEDPEGTEAFVQPQLNSLKEGDEGGLEDVGKGGVKASEPSGTLRPGGVGPADSPATDRLARARARLAAAQKAGS